MTRTMSGTKQFHHETPFPFRHFVPLIATLAFLVFFYIVVLFVTELHEEGSLACCRSSAGGTRRSGLPSCLC